MRKHVMVRIGGGWDTFEHYITKHDPCRTHIAGMLHVQLKNNRPKIKFNKTAR